MTSAALHFNRDTMLAPLPPHPRLTRRLNQVLAMLSVGASNGEIAKAMGIEQSTVRSYIRRIAERFAIETEGHHARVLIVRVATEDTLSRTA
jgi:DNA-binding NarL/FixJ family response regulator